MQGLNLPSNVGLLVEGSFSYNPSSSVLSAKDEKKLVTLDIGSNGDNRLAQLSFKDGRNLEIKALNKKAEFLLDRLYSAKTNNLCYIVAIDYRSKTLQLQGRIFNQAQFYPPDQPLQIVLTEKLISDLTKPEIITKNAEGKITEIKKDRDPLEFVQQEFLVENSFLVALYNDSKIRNTTQSKQFVLIGPKRRCFIELQEDGNFKCDEVKNHHNRNLDSSSFLLYGTINFVDGRLLNNNENNQQNEVDSPNKALFTKLQTTILQSSNYLSKWEIYNELEKELGRQEALELGSIQYDSWQRRYEDEELVYTFVLTKPLTPAKSKRLLKDKVNLDASTEPILEEDSDNPIFPQRNQLVSVGELENTDGKRLVIRATTINEQDPPKKGFLLLSFNGDTVRLKRREKALERIKKARLDAPLPQLALLLETGDAPRPDYRRYNPITEQVKHSFGHSVPTSNQREALDVALNTPDIALIQGPPGTGKTTVIRALVTRLLEKSEDLGQAHSILISSYQHDAVDNAISDLKIEGFPAYRVGGKRSSNQNEPLRLIDQWAEQQRKICEQILQKRGGRPLRQAVRDVDLLINQWTNNRGAQAGQLALIEAIEQVAGQYIERKLLLALRELALKLNSFSQANYRNSAQGSNTIQAELDPEILGKVEKYLENQRCSFEKFLEDGPRQARRLIKFLEEQNFLLSLPSVFEEAAKSPFENIEDLEETDDTKTVRALKSFLERFILAVADAKQSLQNLSDFKKDKVISFEDEIEQDLLRFQDLLEETVANLHEYVETKVDAISAAVETFREDLENLDVAKKLIEKYSNVVAGTCQQVIAGENLDNLPTTYEYVIIDESARANPLDLLIPMSLGKHIILVGDHRQLPHILEEEVKQAFVREKAADRETLEFLEKSLFERLFEQFQKIERNGGVRRTVTLNDDFRMHPTIGNFVSQTFYNNQVTPRRTKEERAHNLGLYNNKPIAWLDVPKSRGLEKSGRSKSRLAEIEVVVKETEEVLKKNPAFQVGIITFYQEQANLIQNRINEAFLESWRERILVGTVDAFQGREFDVVFLSTVRCNNYNAEADKRKRIGFLDSPNRLCVAFSRARRLLVAVGDAETITPAIPELRNFYNICNSEEGFYARC